jgi:hypothetical protein
MDIADGLPAMLFGDLPHPAQQPSRIRADAGQVGKRHPLTQAVQFGPQQLQVAALRCHHDRFPGGRARLHVRENTRGELGWGPVEERSVHEAIRAERSWALHRLTP